jgi:integrase
VPKQAKGDVRFSGGIWRARITLVKKRRHDVPLPTCQSREEAEERALLLAEQAKHLRLAGKVETSAAIGLLEELGRATAGDGVTDAIHVIGEFCGASTFPKRLEGPTFAEVARLWTSGELARDWPDHVKAKNSKADRRIAEYLKGLDVGGIKLGDLPLSRFKLDHAEGAMRQLPKDARRPATRRHYAQVLSRVLTLAVYPLRALKASPLPKGFLPKVGKPPAFPYVYPVEDAALMAHAETPIEERMLFGFLAREGMRVSEALTLTWARVSLEQGTVSLDKNKTNDARTWALDPGVTRALTLWHKLVPHEPSDFVFPPSSERDFEPSRLSGTLRSRLWAAGARRSELHNVGENRGKLRVHDLRGTFVTLSLANGRSETWVADRTGHTSSIMINRYRRASRTAAELKLGPLAPLDRAVVGLDCPRIAHETSRSRGRRGRENRNDSELVAPPGFEPGRPYGPKILSLLRMPVPPRGLNHLGKFAG